MLRSKSQLKLIYSNQPDLFKTSILKTMERINERIREYHKEHCSTWLMPYYAKSSRLTLVYPTYGTDPKSKGKSNSLVPRKKLKLVDLRGPEGEKKKKIDWKDFQLGSIVRAKVRFSFWR